MVTLNDPSLQNISPGQLGELLIEAKKAYYTSGKPIMDDHTYDTLEEILRQKLPHHRIFSKVGSPAFDTGWAKKSHTMPMGSQNKVTTFADLVHYFELKKLPSPTELVVQPKCDGLSVEIEYQNGQLVDAVTRGDGKIGDIITQNIVNMKNFVAHPQNFTGSVRCEIVVTQKDFKKLNQISQEIYLNPRNAASGIAQRLDSQFSQFCSLIAVDISPSLATITQEIDQLQSLGFTPVENHLCQNFDQIEKKYQEFLAKRTKYPFEIDGLVIKINSYQLSQKLGEKNGRPKHQVAYKFPADSNFTRLKSINWQVGPMGTITPVAEIEPIILAGATITFASLANFDLIKEKGINLQDIVEVSRRGDVIPHIEKVVTKVTPGHLSAPTRCPSCHTPLIREDKFLKCPNLSECLPQVIGSLNLFCQTLNILGLSFKTIAKLYQAKLVTLPGDFFSLQVTDISPLDNLGDKSAYNIVSQIQAKRTLNLVEVFDSAVIPNFSHQRIRQLISAGFDTPQKLLHLSISDVEALPGFQKTLAQKIVTGIQARRPWVESILSQVTLKNEPAKSEKNQNLTFCITGTLSLPRDQIVAQIEASGGRVVNTVSRHTSYLVTNHPDSNSTKFLTAQKLGVKIINETELAETISKC